MKTASLILLVAGCVQARGVAYASVANPAPQQRSDISTTTDAGSDHSTHADHATVSSQSKDENKATSSDKRADGRHIPDRIRPQSRASLNKTNRAKQVQHNHERSRPKGVTSMHQQVLPKPASAGSRVVIPHTPPVRPATGFAISGQQFRNGRNRSATPAVIGGPASSTKRTEAISGTGMNRKSLN